MTISPLKSTIYFRTLRPNTKFIPNQSHQPENWTWNRPIHHQILSIFTNGDFQSSTSLQRYSYSNQITRRTYIENAKMVLKNSIKLIVCHFMIILTHQLIESLERDLVIFTFYGRQRPKKMRNQFKSEYNDRNYTNSQSHPEPVTIATNPYLGLVQKQRAELVVFGSRGARIQQKLVWLLPQNKLTTLEP